MAPAAAPNASALGSMCGSGLAASFTASISKWTAPGMCRWAYSALPSRFMVGRYHEASTTPTRGLVRLAASHSVDARTGRVTGWVTGWVMRRI
jgi:hypothetical protein